MKKRFGGRRLLVMVCLSWTCCAMQLSVNGQKTTTPEKKIRLNELLRKVESRDNIYFFTNTAGALLDQPVPAGLDDKPLQELCDKYLPLYGIQCTRDETRKDVYELTVAFIHVMGTVYRGKDAAHITLLKGVNVAIKGTGKGEETNDSGNFSLDSVPADATLRFTSVDLVTRELKALDCRGVKVQMEQRINEYDAAKVFSNGYERKLRNSLTWSASLISGKSMERSGASTVLTGMANRSTSVLYTPPVRESASVEDIAVRGPGTINAGTQPLVVIDDQPYVGDINNINLADVASVTLLKDAAALAIYGVRAGNGVMVITMKKSESAGSRITFTTGFNIQGRPYIPNFSILSAGDLIDFQLKAYQSHYYDASLAGGMAYIPPAVELADAQRRGLISQEELNARLSAMKGVDLQKEISRKFYQTSTEQQYTLQLSGSRAHLKYFLSGGANRYYGTLAGLSRHRYTARGDFEYSIGTRWLLGAIFNYTDAARTNGFNPGYNPASYFTGQKIPSYFDLGDGNGNARTFNGDLNGDYLQQQAAQGYRSASWRPISAMNEELNRQQTRDLVTNLHLTFKVSERWRLVLTMQNETQRRDGNDFFKKDSYVVNTLWNYSAYRDTATGRIVSPVPSGGIADIRRQRIDAFQLRFQANYTFIREGVHDLSVFGGGEYRRISASGDSARHYGVGNPDAPAVINEDIQYPPGITGTGEPQTVPVSMGRRNTLDNFISGYISGNYTYLDRYTLSATFREDFANLFGWATNHNLQPLWSAGAAWHLERENFFSLNFLSKLSLQASAGVMGNIARQGYPYSTLSFTRGGVTGTPYNTAFIMSQPNKYLRWEKVKIYNAGIYFVTRDTRFYGTIDVYSKISGDLMASVQADPTFGGSQNSYAPPSAWMNVARMKTSGVDIDLTMHNLKGSVKWVTNYLISTVHSKVLDYPGQAGAGWQYLDANLPTPVKGGSPYGTYAFRRLYMDQKGNPVGRLNGQPDTNYDAIYNTTTLDSMVYKGTSRPGVFGSIINTISKGPWSLFWNISFKLGYFMRKPVISYSDALRTGNGNGSYAHRFKIAGDEKRTDIPKEDFSGASGRDLYNANAENNVISADHIRVEELGMAYRIDYKKRGPLNIREGRLFINLSNIGPLWIRNKEKIDPYYNNMPKESVRLSIGGSFSF